MTTVGPLRALPITTRWWPLTLPPALVGFLSWGPATQGPTTCPFALATGHACPLCGGTRAATALMRLDAPLAWEMHPLIYLMIPLMVAGYVRWIGVRAGRWRPLPPAGVNRMVMVLIGLFVAVWIVRALTGTLPPV